MASTKRREPLARPEPPKKWQRLARTPTKQQLEADPIGTTYSYRTTQFYYVCTKLDSKRWLESSGRARDDAIAMWHKHAADPPKQDSGYFVSTVEVLISLDEHHKSAARGV